MLFNYSWLVIRSSYHRLHSGSALHHMLTWWLIRCPSSLSSSLVPGSNIFWQSMGCIEWSVVLTNCAGWSGSVCLYPFFTGGRGPHARSLLVMWRWRGHSNHVRGYSSLPVTFGGSRQGKVSFCSTLVVHVSCQILQYLIYPTLISMDQSIVSGLESP